MPRKLTPDEQALWEKVARTVRPLGPRRSPLPAPADGIAQSATPAPPIQADRKSAGPRISAPVLRAAPHPAPPRPTPPSETLDGSWDRRLSSARTRPDRVIDLHGHRLEEARGLLRREVDLAARRGDRLLLVITGKGLDPAPVAADLMPGLAIPGRPTRGAIRASLPRWLADMELSGRIAAVRRAGPRHGGQGAVWLVLKR